jgi:hypothetical protein
VSKAKKIALKYFLARTPEPLKIKESDMSNDIVKTLPRVRDNGGQRNQFLVEHADEYARASQRYADQIAHITDLTRELDDFRGRAIAAEAELVRMQQREKDLLAMLDDRSQQQTRENELLKNTITILRTKFEIASKVILEAFATIGDVSEKPRPKLGTGLEAFADIFGDKEARERPEESDAESRD